MKAKFILLLCVCFISSCGTVKRYHNIVPVDSAPRGINVYDEDEKQIGTTPFFHQMSASRNQTLIFKTDNCPQLDIQTRNYKCNFNWGGSIIPHAILIAWPSTLISGATFTLIDWIFGGMYRCETKMYEKLEKLESKGINPKRRILILPPSTEDESLSDTIISTWIKSQKNNLNGDIIVDHLKIKKEFSFRGINHSSKNNPDDIKKNVLWKTGFKHKATHILFFNIKKSKNLVEITPELYDIFTLTKEHAPYLSKFETKLPNYIKNKFSKALLKAISFLPNSIKLSFTEDPAPTEIINLDSVVTEEHQRHPDAFPKIMSVLSLGSVQHPQFYGSWDYGFSFFPTLSSNAWRSIFKNETTEYIIELQNFNLFYNAGLTLHTPFGALGVEIGLGGIYFYGEDNYGNDYNKVAKATRININHVAFLSSKYYSKIEVSCYFPTHDAITNQYYQLDNWAELSIGVGMYYPPMKSLIRNLLPF